MKKTICYLSIILILSFSCKTDNKTDPAQLDAFKTTELVSQILKDESTGYLSSSCITQKAKAVSHPMVTDFDAYVMNQLKIGDSVHYNLQSKLSSRFKITVDLVPDKNILTEEQFKEFEENSENDGFKFWDWLDENCENGYCSITKPIFNETFDLAYIRIGTVCGSLCGGGEERIYEYKNGKWTVKESLGSWVS